MNIYPVGTLLTFFIWIMSSEAQSCPKAKVQNGRTKIRMRGRMVIYRCKRGYTMHGQKVAVCLSGRWSHPPAKCIATGCPDVDDDSGLVIKSSYEGAMLSFSCPSAYKLQGPVEIFCDKIKWNQEPPTCLARSSMLSCDFEKDDLCGWTQSSNDDFDWLRFSGATPSGFTGPSFDHTFGRTESGHYMFVETSAPRKAGDRAKLVSPLYLPDQSDQCFQLWYHMLGPDGPNDVGSLEVFVQPEGVGLDTLVPEVRQDGNKGDVWLRGVAKIPPLSDKFQIVILAQRKDSYISDIAIDDLRLYNCSEDEGTENTTLSSLSSTSMTLTTAKSTTTTTTITTTITTVKNPTPRPSTTSKPTRTPQPTTPKPPTTSKPQLSRPTTTIKRSTTTSTITTTVKPTTIKPSTPKPTTTKPPTQKPTTPKPTTAKSPTQRPTTPKPTSTKPPTQRPTTPKPPTLKPTTTAAKTTVSNSTSNLSERLTSPTPKPTKRTRQTKPTTAKPTAENTTSRKAVSVTSMISTLVIQTSPTHKPSSASMTATPVYSTPNSTFINNANISNTTVYEVDIRPRKTFSDDNNGYLIPMGIGIGSGLLFTVIVVAIFAWVWVKKKKRRSIEPDDEMEPITKSTSNNSLNLNLVNEYEHM